MKVVKKIVIVLFVLIAVSMVCLAICKRAFSESVHVVYKTQSAGRCDLCKTISATGTLEPEELVNVGAQIGGMITEFGKDEHGSDVNYCSTVKQGMLLVKIDDSIYRAEVNIADAVKKQQEAAIENAKAVLQESASELSLAQSNWERAETLYPRSAIARSDYDSAKTAWESAKASQAIQNAKLIEAKASLASAEASLTKCKRNLAYCVIKSPVDGVIIDRRVSIGQTVNASMNAPSLFLIAKDLRKMQVWVSVNEADIGYIKEGQQVIFTVDARPGKMFYGVVHKIRLNATMSQNVVTFVVEISTENSENLLLPYLTANVKFVLDSRKDVIAVPNSALRFSPPLKTEGSHADKMNPDEKTVWILKDGVPIPVIVKIGLNDGNNTEILSGNIEPGMQIITGSSTVTVSEEGGADMKGDTANSPFLPKPPKFKGQKK